MSNKKKIVRAKEELDASRCGVFATAKEALKAGDFGLVHFGLDDFGIDLPEKFKLSVRVRFTRTDGKVVARRILQSVKDWGYGHEEIIPWGSGYNEFDECYHPSYVTF